MNVRFVSREELTPGISSFWFKPDKPLEYQAGQFIELTIPHDADNRGGHRWFTLSSAPTNELLSITTRLADQPSTFKQALQALQPNDSVNISQPMGDFVLPRDASIPLLFAVAGIGITPVHSILQYLKDSGEQRTIRVLYAVPSMGEAAFTDIVDWADSEAEYFVSRPIDSEKPARLTSQRITEVAATLNNPFIFISGPEELVEVLVDKLRQSGIKNSRLVTDYFQGYGEQI